MARRAVTGRALVEDVRTRWVPEGAIAVWWLGQSSIIVRGAGLTVYIDPYLKPDSRRIVPPAMRREEVTNADVVLLTHEHDDHIDPTAVPGIATASPGAAFVLPKAALDKVRSLGISTGRLVMAETDRKLTFGPLEVTPIPAAHEELDYSPEHGYPYAGYLLRLNGVRLYHSGDSLVYDGLTERLQAHGVDLGFLPINGRDYKRTKSNTIGNMSGREAADLADAADVDTIVPVHYGMFRHNSEPVGRFLDYVADFYPEQKVKVMARYEGYVHLSPSAHAKGD